MHDYNMSLPILSSSMAAITENCSDCSMPLGGFIIPPQPYNNTVTIVLAILAGITSIATTVGNIMVLVSFFMERNIRTASNYLIASLAVTDVLIGSLSMPLYTLYLLKDYWPLGQFVCELWLSLDYTVCLVSQYTVFLITLDRFCSVKVPAKYRNWRTERKMLIMIAVTWVVPSLIFFTSIMGWHHFVTSAVPKPGQCVAMFQNNKLFSALLVISYYWVTLLIMIILYIGIYQAALTLHMKSQQIKARVNRIANLSNSKGNCNNENMERKLLLAEENLRISPSPQSSSDSHDSMSTKKKAEVPTSLPGSLMPTTLTVKDVGIEKDQKLPAESPLWKPRGSLPNTSIHWDAFSGQTYHTVQSDTPQESSPMKNQSPKQRNGTTAQITDAYESGSDTSDSEQKPRGIRNLTKSLINNIATPKQKPKEAKSKSVNRAMKALKTITFILGAFVFCWTPYHVNVLVDSFCKKEDGCVQSQFYQFSYWLCYMNSPINPFCYALSNQQFKKAFLKILKGEYFREWLQKRK